MKTLKIVSVLCLVLFVSSCKQDDCLDWKAQNELWLLENAKREGVVTTPTGLQYERIYDGPFHNDPNAVRLDNAKMVFVNYRGQLINGYEFSSADSTTLYVSDLIPGLVEGLKKMTEFSIYKFYIPYQLGYGKKGTGIEGNSSYIPPYSTLIFYVELNDIPE